MEDKESLNMSIERENKENEIEDERKITYAFESLIKKNMWVIRSGLESNFFDEFKEANIIGVEWVIEDLSKIKNLKSTLSNIYTTTSKSIIGRWATELNRFYKQIQIGDLIITSNPKTRIYLIGVIESNYFYDPSKYPKFPHLRKVKWIEQVSWSIVSKSTSKLLNSNRLTVFPITDEDCKKELINLLINKTTKIHDLKNLIREWAYIAKKYTKGKHFDLSEEKRNKIIERVKKFLDDPTEENFRAFWELLDSVGSMKISPISPSKILDKEDVKKEKVLREHLEEFAKKLEELLNAEEYIPDLEKEWGLPASLRELYGFWNIKRKPIVNGCTKGALKTLISAKGMKTYQDVEKAFNEFKELYIEVMKEELGREQVTELPLNLEIDQFLNVIHKVNEEKDIKGELNEEIREFYKHVLEFNERYDIEENKSKEESTKVVHQQSEPNDCPSFDKAPLNLILYGPPGTGKTYTAVKCNPAKSSSTDEDGDKDHGIFITFHPSYDYTDFIEGIRPKVEGESIAYEIKDGTLKEIAKKALRAALERAGKAPKEGVSWAELLQAYDEIKGKDKRELWEDAPPFVLIIDEINRADIARVFGELITLIEEDKRLEAEEEVRVRLPYTQELFALPKNVYIWATMNTADKSISHIDAALRRRFIFHRMDPEPKKIENLVYRQKLEELNKRLRENENVGREKQVGHTYFMNIDEEKIDMILKEKIFPLLEDYFVYSERELKEFLIKLMDLKEKAEETDYSELKEKFVEWFKKGGN